MVVFVSFLTISHHSIGQRIRGLDQLQAMIDGTFGNRWQVLPGLTVEFDMAATVYAYDWALCVGI